MATKKYLSLEGLSEYDALIKEEIASGDESAVLSAKNYTDTKTANFVTSPTVDGKISSHNTSTESHNDIRDLITNLTSRLNALADSDDTTLDQMSEIVAYIKSNKDLIDAVTTSKVNVSDIVNNLTTNVANKPLSAAQGVAIKTLIEAIQEDVGGKAEASVLSDYYTKEEIDSYELIDVTDIDAICGGSIQYASINEVTF